MALDKIAARIDAAHTVPPVRSRRPENASTYGLLPAPAPIDFDRLARDLSTPGRYIDDPAWILADLDEGIAEGSRIAAGGDSRSTQAVRGGG